MPNIPISKLSLAYAAAAKADADYRTAIKVLDGKPVKGRVGDRIKRALAELGQEPGHGGS